MNGTVNDLAMMGARPLYMSVGLILEEGLDLAELAIILTSMRRAADAAGIAIVTITLREESLPINPGVRGVCSLLGLDPLYVANEGSA